VISPPCASTTRCTSRRVARTSSPAREIVPLETTERSICGVVGPSPDPAGSDADRSALPPASESAPPPDPLLEPEPESESEAAGTDSPEMASEPPSEVEQAASAAVVVSAMRSPTAREAVEAAVEVVMTVRRRRRGERFRP
jgi:hypothetical protein